MKNKIKIPALALTVGLASVLSGCAGVDIYSDATLTHKTGIAIYAPKPYLLIARTDAKDKPMDISIIYLPDEQRVSYAVPRSGFGSTKLAMSLANGQLTSFGQDSTLKMDDITGPLAAILTANAGASKTRAEADAIRYELHGADTVKAGQGVTTIASDMAARIKNGDLAGLNKSDRDIVVNAQRVLKVAGETLSNPEAAPLAKDQLAAVKTQAELLDKLPDASAAGTKMDVGLQYVQTWVNELNKLHGIAQKEVEPKAPKPTFELYEIIRGTGGTQLRLILTNDTPPNAGQPAQAVH
jgi:hypothetical protein